MNSSILLLVSIFLSLLMIISSSSLLFSWASLEMNLIFVLFSMYKNETTLKAIFCYFVFQILGSLLFLAGFFGVFFYYFFFAGLMIKFGLFPFHIWQPFVFMFSDWSICFIIAGPQKVMLILFLAFFQMSMPSGVMLLLLTSILVTNFCFLFLFDLKKAFAYLSLSSSAWLFLASMLALEQSILFLGLYNVQLLFAAVIFFSMNFFNFFDTKFFQLFMFLFFISYSGLPPLVGFFMKTQILFILFSSSWSVWLTLILTTTMMISIFYILYSLLKTSVKMSKNLLQQGFFFFTLLSLSLCFLPSFFLFF